MENVSRVSDVDALIRAEDNRYSLAAIMGIWFLATAPMALLSWGVAPFLIPRVSLEPGLVYWLSIIVGMVWQFILAVILLRRERRDWTWRSLSERLWLRAPVDPRSGRRRFALLWWVIPGVLFAGLASEVLGSCIDAPFSMILPPSLTPAYADIRTLATPAFAGDWRLLWIALVSSLFNYVLGEALLFHGVLMPKMIDVFGRWAWLANAVLFGLYHIHIIWALPSIIISNAAYSWPMQKFRSVWLAVLIHGFEGLILIAVVLWVINGSK